MKTLTSRFARADAPGAQELATLLATLQVGQRLRVADLAVVTPGETAQVTPAPTTSAEGRRLDLVGNMVQRASAVDMGTRECSLSFSSETPYERWWGVEILGHKAGECDMGWIGSGYAPALSDHDPGEQIGVISKAWRGGDGRNHAVIRFGKSDEAQEEMQDAADGVRVNVSVGYEIRELELVKREGDQATYRVTDWMPLEVSLVSIPADMTVGVGRSASTPAAPAATLPAQPRTTTKEHTMTDPVTKPAEGDAAFRANVQAITRLAEAYSQWVKPADVSKAIAEGADAQKFQDAIMARMASPVTDATTTAALGLTPNEVKRFSFLRAVQAQLPNAGADAGFERSVSKAIGQALGREAEGFFIPPDLFGTAKQQRDFTAGTAGEAGNLVQTEVMGAMFTDVLRPMLVMGALGVTILPGLRSNVAIPRKTVAGTLAMLAEVAAAAETQPTTAQVLMSPKRVSSFVEPSKQAIIQSEVGIEQMLRNDLLAGAAVLMENNGINGNGTAPNPRGIRNVSGIGSVVGGTNGANLAWSHIVGLETACANANANSTDLAGYLINTKTRGSSKTTTKTSFAFIWADGDLPLNGYRAAVTNNVPSNLTKGTSSGVCSSAIFSSDWSMLCLGIFGGLDMTVDPYTLATTGQIRITLNQYHDWACRQPGAFASMDDLLTP